MSMIILLDAGPLGMLTSPLASPSSRESTYWLRSLIERQVPVAVPEIADYEVRRELVRGQRTQSIARLDALKQAIGYVPLTTDAMLKAAEFWADVRNRGLPTADEKALDGDVILAAQAALLTNGEDEAVIAT